MPTRELPIVNKLGLHARAASRFVTTASQFNARITVTKDGREVSSFVGAQSPQSVASFLDGLLGPSSGEQLLEELAASGEFPAILGPLAEGDYERALEWLLAQALEAPPEERERIREVMVAIFTHLGQDHPHSTTYRRRLATALY